MRTVSRRSRYDFKTTSTLFAREHTPELHAQAHALTQKSLQIYCFFLKPPNKSGEKCTKSSIFMNKNVDLVLFLRKKAKKRVAETTLSGGGRDRTNDLQVMSLTSYHCSTPRSVLVSPYDLRANFYLRFLRRAFSLFTFLLRDFFKKNSLLRASWMVPALLTCLLNLRRASSKVSFSRTEVFGMYFTSLKLSQRDYYYKVV